MTWNLFTKDEKLSEKFPLRLTPTEMKWVRSQSKKECNSDNGLIRKAINNYQNTIETKSD